MVGAVIDVCASPTPLCAHARPPTWRPSKRREGRRSQVVRDMTRMSLRTCYISAELVLGTLTSAQTWDLPGEGGEPAVANSIINWHKRCALKQAR